MKTYETWEAIKMKTEDKNKEFIGTDGKFKYELLNLSGGELKIIKLRPDGDAWLDYIPSGIKWELARNPVDFMTAAKAHDEGKTIYCKNPESVDKSGRFATYQSSKDILPYLIDGNGDCITSNEILKMDWYIEEEEA